MARSAPVRSSSGHVRSRSIVALAAQGGGCRGSPFFGAPGQAVRETPPVCAANRTGILMAPEYAEIQRLLDAMHTACEADRVAQTLDTRRAVHIAGERLRVARATVRTDFAAQHGWVCSERLFTIGELRHRSTRARRGYDSSFQLSSMDHAEYFRLAQRPWCPVAVLSHEYGSFESSVALASEQRITATLLPTSWYWPGRANAVLYMGYYSLCL
jgi:hypothetical protein